MKKNDIFDGYDFFQIFVALMLLEHKDYVINKDKLQIDLLKYYDDVKYNFLFNDIVTKKSVDYKYVYLFLLFLKAKGYGLLKMINENKYIINITEKEANDIISKYNGIYVYYINKIVNDLYSKHNLDSILEYQDNYLIYLNNMNINNPEEAKRISMNSLISAGIMNECGEILPPYNNIFSFDDLTKKTKTLKMENNKKTKNKD